jgi:CSLREA domain-containing protein
MRQTIQSLLALAALAIVALPSATRAITFTVNSNADTPDANPGDGICADGTGACSLRAAEGESAALAFANVPPCAEPLPELHILAISGTVSTGTPFNFRTGLCSRTVEIRGPGATNLTILGGGFQVGGNAVAGSSASISGLTISGAAIGIDDSGSTLFDGLALSDVVVSGNGTGIHLGFEAVTGLTNSKVVGNGTAGIIGPEGPTLRLELTDSNVDDNGGVGIAASILSIDVTRSTVRRNAGFGIDAGGVAVPTINVVDSLIESNADTGIRDLPGAVHLTRSTVSGNLGGGLFVMGGPATVLNSTISGNKSAGSGGGLLYTGLAPMRVMSSTIAFNTADSDGDGSGDGGGIFVTDGPVVLANTIVGGNVDRGSEAPDCGGQLVSEGHNLVSTASGCVLTGPGVGDVVGAAPLLGPLADNGGATPTHAFLIGSPAIDAGDPTGCRDEAGALLTTDQRGFPRPQGAACDMGAFEQAAPDAALAMCNEDLSECRADLIPDSDGDGEVDTTDRCPETPPGEAVDDAGCSRAQFCAGFAVATPEGKRACRRADWRNDEPLLLRSDDCAVAKGGSGTDDDRCVPAD